MVMKMKQDAGARDAAAPVSYLIKDPVCGMSFSLDESAGSSEHAGETYYFCSDACQEAFDLNPYAYVDRADARLNPSPD